MAALPDVGVEPDYGMAESAEFSVDRVQFGSGYEQRRPSGLNSVRRQWAVEWPALNRSQMEMLRNFLLETKGVTGFDWEIPEEEVVRVVCRQAPRVVYEDYNVYSLSATFVEDFAP